MALIKCQECDKEISDQAEACPGCGHPIKPVKSEPPTVTVEGIKKSHAGLKAIGFIAIVIGLIWTMSGSGKTIGPALLLGGFVVFIIARFMD